MRLDSGRYETLLGSVLIVAAVVLPANPLMGQAPSWPVPVPTPSPTPPPEPSSPETPPEPERAPETGAAEETPQDGDVGEGPAEKAEEIPEAEQEVNPGDVAFTDYQPFDLEEIEEETMKTKWGNFVAGLRGISRYSLWDGKVKFRIGGKAQFDGTAGFNDDQYEEFHPPLQSGADVRRLELFAAGRIKDFNFNLAFDFGADWGISDAWIEGAKGGLEVWGHFLGKLRIGWFGEPFSLERQTGAYNLGLMERSLPVQTFSPGSNIGAMVHDSGTKGRFTWAAGIFSIGQSNDENASNSLLSLTGRATYLPTYRDQGRHLLHLGVSVSSRSPGGSSTRYRSRPEARFAPYLVDTDRMDVSQITLAGLEVAGVRGPLWFAAEHIWSKASAQAIGDPTFKGTYVQVGWFVTGESRPYRTNSGTFDRLRPANKYRKGNPFKRRNGGAVGLVGRLSRIDLTDGDIDGGEMTDFSAALSWYPNATTRIELNYVFASPKGQGVANIFMLRLRYQPW
jgi:phosphate-selective porin OprO/OprP